MIPGVRRVTMNAEPLEPTGNEGQFRMGDTVIIHTTPKLARQWMAALEQIAEETK